MTAVGLFSDVAALVDQGDTPVTPRGQVGMAVTFDGDTARVDGEAAPLLVNSDGRLKVATKPGHFPTVVGDLAALASQVAVYVGDASNVVLHVKNAGAASMAAGAFAFEASLDSTNGVDGTWFGVQACRSNANTIEAATGTVSLAVGAGMAYSWEASVNAYEWLRVRCTTAVTASALARWTIVRGSYATEPVPAIATHAVTGTITANQGTVNAGSVNKTTTTAGTNGANIKTSAATVYSVLAHNPTATPAHIKLYDLASAPVVGTTLPVRTITVPATSDITEQFGALGARFGTGLGRAVTGAWADTDTTNAPAGVVVNITYI